MVSLKEMKDDVANLLPPIRLLDGEARVLKFIDEPQKTYNERFEKEQYFVKVEDLNKGEQGIFYFGKKLAKQLVDAAEELGFSEDDNLTGMVIEVKRIGSGLQTTYVILNAWEDEAAYRKEKKRR